MENAFYGIILKFSQEVGMENAFLQHFKITVEVTLVIAMLICFFGYKLLRLCSAVMTFFLTAIAICEMLKPTAQMGVIVTTFAVVGIIAAFLVYQWNRFNVFMFSAMLGYSIAALFTANLWICIGTGILLGLASVLFTPMVVVLATAMWGGVILSFSSLPYMGVHLMLYKIIAALGLSAGGVLLQYFMNRRDLVPVKLWSSQKFAFKH